MLRFGKTRAVVQRGRFFSASTVCANLEGVRESGKEMSVATETHAEWLERMYACQLRRTLPREAEVMHHCDEEVDLDREVIYRSARFADEQGDQEGVWTDWEAHVFPPLLRRQSGFHDPFRVIKI